MTRIRLAGRGGQGIQLAGVVLADAVARSGSNVACTQTYGPQSRGGTSRADLILHDGDIAYPRPRRLDILIALTPEACRRSMPDLEAAGILIADSSVAPDGLGSAATVLVLPIVKTAERLGSHLQAGLVALGALRSVRPIVGCEALIEAVGRHARDARVRNLNALEAGFALAARALESGARVALEPES